MGIERVNHADTLEVIGIDAGRGTEVVAALQQIGFAINAGGDVLLKQKKVFINK